MQRGDYETGTCQSSMEGEMQQFYEWYRREMGQVGCSLRN